MLEDSEKPLDNKKELSKKERAEKSRAKLIGNLAANRLIGVREKVAYILNHFPDTRNSDTKLAFKYWELFHPDSFTNRTIDEENFTTLTRYTSITRARAKIQNEFRLYQADTHIKNRRKNLSEQEKDDQVADKPGLPIIYFYLDESSKNSKYVAVGGLCSLDSFRGYKLTEHLKDWRKKNAIKSEFHFSQMSKKKLDEYKSFFREAYGFADTLSFKVSLLSHSGLRRDMDDIIRGLYQHFVGHSIDHEISQKRVTLPRRVSIFKDKEGEADSILVSRIKESLEAYYVTKYDRKLSLESITPVDSRNNDFLQLADLFIGSVCRVVNRPDSASRNHKDQLADYVLSLLGIDFSSTSSTNQDSSYIDFM